MNIFIPFHDPKENAKCLDNLLVNKMTTETAQMLNTALWLNNIKAPFKKTHHNHPCAVWIRKSRQNFQYGIDLGLALADEFEYRRGKIHGSKKAITFCIDYINIFPDKGLTPFRNCTDSYKHISDVHLAYKLQLSKKWDTRKWSTKTIQKPIWQKREIPNFYQKNDLNYLHMENIDV